MRYYYVVIDFVGGILTGIGEIELNGPETALVLRLTSGIVSS